MTTAALALLLLTQQPTCKPVKMPPIAPECQTVLPVVESWDDPGVRVLRAGERNSIVQDNLDPAGSPKQLCQMLEKRRQARFSVPLKGLFGGGLEVVSDD